MSPKAMNSLKSKRTNQEDRERHVFHQKLKQVEELRWKEIEELDEEDLGIGCRKHDES
jgi:hypothetical protein